MALEKQDIILTLENQDIIQKSINPIDVIPVIAVGSVSNLMSGVLQVLLPGWAHFFTYGCQLLVKDEHWVHVLVKGFGLSLPRKRVVRIDKSFWHYRSCLAWMLSKKSTQKHLYLPNLTIFYCYPIWSLRKIELKATIRVTLVQEVGRHNGQRMNAAFWKALDVTGIIFQLTYGLFLIFKLILQN